MFIGDSKFIRIIATIAFSVVCLALTAAFVIPYLVSENKPPLRAVLFVILFDIVSVGLLIYYFTKKK